jgi:hypothetical protein
LWLAVGNSTAFVIQLNASLFTNKRPSGSLLNDSYKQRSDCWLQKKTRTIVLFSVGLVVLLANSMECG